MEKFSSVSEPLKTVDGVKLHESGFNFVFKHRLDDIRLKCGDDILVATYPRTGGYSYIAIFDILVGKLF